MLIQAASSIFTVNATNPTREIRVFGRRLAKTHLDIKFCFSGFIAFENFLYLNPVFAIVLFKDAASREGANILFAELFFNVIWRVGFDNDESPDFDFPRAARVPGANGVNSGQERTRWKNGHVLPHHPLTEQIAAQSF